MCGIVGFVGDGDQRDLQAMVAALEHRGPDASGTYVDEQSAVYLGSRRLAVRDIKGGTQPMHSDDGQLIVVCNGEIYNADQLRIELEGLGHRFRTSHSDTEVLLYGWRQWGEELVSRLCGMWAFAILDRTQQRLFLSRDRFGQKPLYVCQQGGIFAFASEPATLLRHRGLQLSLSRTGLHKYCAHGYFPGEHTIYQQVRKVRGGHNLSFDLRESTAHTKRYWSYQVEPEGDCGDAAEQRWAEQVRDLLTQSVSRRMVSDVPLGIFLSGGLDSSAVAAIAAAHRGASPLLSFSVGFEEQGFDETTSAQAVADLLGTEHQVSMFTASRLSTISAEVFDRLGEPLSDSSMLSYYVLCKSARERVTVALGGDAADELFAGYDPFRALRYAELAERALPRPIHHGIRALISRLGPSHGYMPMRFKLNRGLRGIGHRPALWNPLWLAPVSPDELEELLAEPIDLEELYSEAIELWESCKADHPVDRSLQFFGSLFLQDDILVKVDRMSMMHGLEVRSPFLDRDLVDCVRRIPHGLKLRGKTGKYILKKAVEPLLPAEIIHRPKVGFSAPLGRWLADGAVTPDADALPMGWSQDLVRDKVQRHQRRQDDHRLLLWNLYALSEFMKRAEATISSETGTAPGPRGR